MLTFNIAVYGSLRAGERHHSLLHARGHATVRLKDLKINGVIVEDPLGERFICADQLLSTEKDLTKLHSLEVYNVSEYIYLNVKEFQELAGNTTTRVFVNPLLRLGSSVIYLFINEKLKEKDLQVDQPASTCC